MYGVLAFSFGYSLRVVIRAADRPAHHVFVLRKRVLCGLFVWVRSVAFKRHDKPTQAKSEERKNTTMRSKTSGVWDIRGDQKTKPYRWSVYSDRLNATDAFTSARQTHFVEFPAVKRCRFAVCKLCNDANWSEKVKKEARMFIDAIFISFIISN